IGAASGSGSSDSGFTSAGSSVGVGRLGADALPLLSFDLVFALPLFEPESFDATMFESFQSDAGFRFLRTTKSLESKIQAMATPTVNLVKTSQVRAPNAIQPPIPQKAPASPPPFPRWIKIRIIRKSVSMTMIRFRNPRR